MRRTAAVFFLALATPAVAFAKPSARLDVERDASADVCPVADELERAVAERLGYRALRSDADASISVRFSRDDGGRFAARVTQRDARGLLAGERTLEDEGADCADLADAVVLTVSVLLESTDLTPRRPVERAAPSDAIDALPAAPAASKMEILPRLRLAGTASFGVAPAMAPGLALGGGIQSGTWSLDLEGRADLAAEDTRAAGTVRTSLRMAQLVPCKHVGFVAGCAIVGAGVLAMEGIDVTNARSDTRFHAVGGLRLAVEPQIGRGFFVSAHADALVAFTRTTVAVGAQDAWTTPPLGVSLGAGAGYVFR